MWLAQTPRICWLKPMVQSDITLILGRHRARPAPPGASPARRSSSPVLERVGLDELRVVLEGDRLRVIRRLSWQPSSPADARAQPVADVGRAQFEVDVLLDEVLVDAAGRDDVVGDVVEDREVGPRLEDDRDVGKIEGAVLKVESTATFTCGLPMPRSAMRVHRIGCISAMLEPQSTNASAASISS